MQWGTQYAVGTRYAVGVSAKKVNSQSVDLANMGSGDLLPLVQKGQTHAVGYTVCSRYAVCSRCKKGQLTVYLANIGGGDCYL